MEQNVVKIEVGKYYVTREGKVEGPVGAQTRLKATGPEFYVHKGEGLLRYKREYHRNGRHNLLAESALDLIAEYVGGVDGPVSGEVECVGTFQAPLASLTIEGRKDDTGKEPLDLLAPEFLFATARVLGFGAEKYTTVMDSEWARLLFAPNVVGLSLLSTDTFAVHVTRDSCGGRIQNSLSVSERTPADGISLTQTKFEQTLSDGALIRNFEHEIRNLAGTHYFGNTDSTKQAMSNLNGKAARSADVSEPKLITLTIAIRQGNFEDSYAVDATTVSECLAMMLQGWNARWPTYAKASPRVEISGRRNWEAGMGWGRVFAAMMRHMWAWWGGAGPTTKNFLFGETDAETGFSHLWHASACLMFLVAYEERNVGADDRWKS